MTVRASTMTVLAPPVDVTEPLDRNLLAAAAVAWSLALASGLWARGRARRRAH